LTNDTDADGGHLNATAPTLTTTNHATVIIDSNGNFTHDALHRYSGEDSFTYSEDDGHGRTASGTITIDNVLGDHPPVAQEDDFTTVQDAGFSGNVLADNGHGVDTDPDGDP